MTTPAGTGRARIGVVGLGQGRHLARWATRAGLEVVAGCDLDRARLDAAEEIPTRSNNWADLLDLGLDGVAHADDFDTHAPLAIAFLERGEIGQVELIEADYLHGLAPAAIGALLGPSDHWRNRISATAYCTHTLSPILAVSGADPVAVSAHAVVDMDRPRAVVMVVRLSSGALAVARHGFLQGEPDSHWSWLSARGDRGLVENVRARGEDAWSVRIRVEPWASVGAKARDEVVVPPPMALAGEPVERAAEGTAAVLAAFRATVEDGAEPLVPVRAAVAASLVGVAGAESLRRGSSPVPVPSLG